jgi:hypothetical protein
MNKHQKIENFNPNSAGLKDSNIFGLPFSAEESDVVLIPVPWEVTVSYGSGASEGTYFYIVTGKGNDNKDFEAKGYLTLVR